MIVCFVEGRDGVLVVPYKRRTERKKDKKNGKYACSLPAQPYHPQDKTARIRVFLHYGIFRTLVMVVTTLARRSLAFCTMYANAKCEGWGRVRGAMHVRRRIEARQDRKTRNIRTVFMQSGRPAAQCKEIFVPRR